MRCREQEHLQRTDSIAPYLLLVKATETCTAGQAASQIAAAVAAACACRSQLPDLLQLACRNGMLSINRNIMSANSMLWLSRAWYALGGPLVSDEARHPHLQDQFLQLYITALH
jgi:hypothetical protein